ncbi:MAG: hypothetical protein ACREUF_19490, partial [Solimonas sp.]
ITASDTTTLSEVNAAGKGTARATTYQYDNAGRRVAVTDPTGNFQWYSYNANGTLAWDIFGNWSDNGRTLTTQYDLAGRKIRETRYTSELANSSLVGQTATQLNGGQRLESADGNYAVVLTNLGELEVLHKGERVWAAGTRETVAGATYQLRAQTDGDLVLWRTVAGVDSVVTTIAATTNSGASFIKIDNAGNFGFNLGTAPTGTEVWDADTAGKTAIGNAGKFSETVYSYDGLGNLATVTDANGVVTSFKYDKLGRLIERSNTVLVEQAGAMVAVAVQNLFEYDAFGRAVKTTDARGNASYAYFDQLGRVTLAVDAAGYAASTAYNAFGEVASLTRHYVKTTGATKTAKPALVGHGLDAVTHYVYDKLGRVTLTVDAELYATQTAYTAFGEVKEVIRFANKAATPPAGSDYAAPTADAARDAKTSMAYD